MPRMTEAETANRTRLAFLTRQYLCGWLSRKEKARLAIASEQVRQLIPRVTAEDFEVLKAMLEDAERIGADDMERRQRLEIGD